MPTYWEFFATNNASGAFSGAVADAAGGPRWGALGAPILTVTGGTAQFTIGAPPGRTFLDRTTGNWGTTLAGDRICMIIGSTRRFAEVTAVVSPTRIEIAGTYSGPPHPTEVRVGGVALTTLATDLRTFMERMLAGTYLTPNAWRLNLNRSGFPWQPPQISSSLVGIGPAHKALTMQGFANVAGDLVNLEDRPKFAGSNGTVMVTLDQADTRIRFYDLDFEFQPASTDAAPAYYAALRVTMPDNTFARCKISVIGTFAAPVQVVRLENAENTIRTCWIVRPIAPARIAPDTEGTRFPSANIFVTHNDPDPRGDGVATLLGNLLDAPTTELSLANCGIHLQSGNIKGGAPHQIANNIFRKQPIAVFAESILETGGNTFPAVRFERNTVLGPASYGVVTKWQKNGNAPSGDLVVANNVFARLNASRSAGIAADSKLNPDAVCAGYLGFNAFCDAYSTIDTQLLFDTSEQHRFIAPNGRLFVNETNENYQLDWYDPPPGRDELGINSALQIGGRLSGSPPLSNFENRTDPGACCRQLF